jgi:hypothetical protein
MEGGGAMKWTAIETEDGEARVIDTETNRVIARIISEPFQGMSDANLIASAPDMEETLHEVNERIAGLLLAVTAYEYVQKEER